MSSYVPSYFDLGHVFADPDALNPRYQVSEPVSFLSRRPRLQYFESAHTPHVSKARDEKQKISRE